MGKSSLEDNGRFLKIWFSEWFARVRKRRGKLRLERFW